MASAGVVLVIEENSAVRDLILEALMDADYDVRAAGTGADGINLFMAPSSVDVAIIDVNMAGMNGEQTANRLHKKDPNLPVLAITGGDLEMPPYWANALLKKPFSIVQLRGEVNKLTRRPE